MAVQWGCASNAPAQRSSRRGGVGPVVAPPRDDRGNPPFYDVFGSAFRLATAEGYRARGVASWYGRDFHGLSTSSGETTWTR